MATAYASFANGGHRVQPYFVEQIYDFDNKLLFQANPQQACALCFNNSLEKLNQAQIKAAKEARELAAEEEKKALAAKAEAGSDEDAKETEEVAAETDANLDSDAEDTGDAKVVAEDLKIFNAAPAIDRLKAPVTQYQAATQAPRILTSSVAYEMAGILRDVVQRGTATPARALGRDDIGGKTGTTNDYKDAWFAGFHPTNVAIVWMGFDQPNTLGRSEYGGVAALPVWVDFMRGQLAKTPHQWVSIDNKSKSKKQQQNIMEVTDEGVVTVDPKTGAKSDAEPASSRKPVKPKPVERQLPPEEVAPETPARAAAQPSPAARLTRERPAAAPQSPLTINPATEMPPMGD
jgi:penicillin-binding protein 1A